MDIRHSPIRPIIDFIVFSNLWIALAAALLYVASLLLLGETEVIGPAFFLILFSSFSGYNLLRLISLSNPDVQKADGIMASWIQRHKYLVSAIGALSGIAGIYFFFQLEGKLQLVYVVAALIGALYGLPLFGKHQQKRRLRDIALLKTFLVGFVWMLLCAVIPAIQAGAGLSEAIFLSLEVFFLIVGLTVPFDIRDMQYDEADRLVTFPIKYGVEGAKRFARLLIGMAWLIYFVHLMITPKFFAGTVHYSYPANLLYFVFISIMVYGMRQFIDSLEKDNSEYSYTFVLDGSIVLFGAGIVTIHFLIRNVIV